MQASSSPGAPHLRGSVCSLHPAEGLVAMHFLICRSMRLLQTWTLQGHCARPGPARLLGGQGHGSDAQHGSFCPGWDNRQEAGVSTCSGFIKSFLFLNDKIGIDPVP